MGIHPTRRSLNEQYEARVAQLRGERFVRRPASTRRPMRRWVGRQLVRVGTRLAADPSMRAARSR